MFWCSSNKFSLVSLLIWAEIGEMTERSNRVDRFKALSSHQHWYHVNRSDDGHNVCYAAFAEENLNEHSSGHGDQYRSFECTIYTVNTNTVAH